MRIFDGCRVGLCGRMVYNKLDHFINVWWPSYFSSEKMSSLFLDWQFLALEYADVFGAFCQTVLGPTGSMLAN